jgi:cobalt-zinc-cadmium efflux system outer membrane protein
VAGPTTRRVRVVDEEVGMATFPARCALGAFVALACLAPVAARAQEPLTVDAAVAAALSANPALAAAREHAAALAEMPPRMGTLPDPSLKLGAANLPVDTFSTGQEPMTQLQVGISQMFPFPGKLGLRREAAARDAEAAGSDADEAGRMLAGRVGAAWWDLFATGQALGIVHANQSLLREFVAVARTKYEVGKGLQQDVLLAELELSKLADQVLALEGRRAGQAATLNALMGRPADAPVRLAENVSEDLPGAPPLADLIARARADRPTLAAAARRLDAAGSRLRLTEKAHQPDFMLSATYGFRQGENPGGADRPDMATLMVSFDLPVHRANRQGREVAEARRGVARQADALADLTHRVEADVTSLRASYEQSRTQARLFREGIIPQAGQTVASMLAGYQVDKVDFLNLVRAQVTLYGYQIEYWRALAAARSAQARLTAAVGGTLPPAPAGPTE